jgi:hypothetical protein
MPVTLSTASSTRTSPAVTRVSLKAILDELMSGL